MEAHKCVIRFFFPTSKASRLNSFPGCVSENVPVPDDTIWWCIWWYTHLHLKPIPISTYQPQSTTSSVFQRDGGDIEISPIHGGPAWKEWCIGSRIDGFTSTSSPFSVENPPFPSSIWSPWLVPLLIASGVSDHLVWAMELWLWSNRGGAL